MIRNWYEGTKRHVVVRWKKILLYTGGGLLILLTLVQVFYPSTRLLPYANIEGVNVGGWNKTDATWQLDKDYSTETVSVYFGDIKKAYKTPSLASIGIKVLNSQRVMTMDYPWYLRIAPLSIFWGHFAITTGENPVYSRDVIALKKYIDAELGASCDVKPQDATLKVNNGNIDLVKSTLGGSCDVAVLTGKLLAVKPTIVNENKVNIPIKIINPAVTDDSALKLADQIKTRVGTGIAISTGSTTQVIPVKDLLGWFDFSVVEGKLTYVLNGDRSNLYLGGTIAPKVKVASGVTTISTYDFVETSRVTGPSGQVLDNAATLGVLQQYIDSEIDNPVAAVAPIAPTVSYKRSYSPSAVGLSALMQNYASSHAGVYGVALAELSGANRNASYNTDKSFTAASTYKLFVAYSALLRVEAGQWQWSDQIQGGRDLSTCFDDMIVKSDNACGEALLTKIDYAPITNEAHAIGLNSTSFMGKDGIKTTPGDLSLFLSLLQTGQILSQQSSRDRLIGAMQKNIYRQGIPAGATGTVADKVGFIDGLLHDAAIVYSPNGTYVLTIMTDGASWNSIAELTRQIEALRIQ